MNTFFELSIILVIATIIAGLMRVLKQPLIIGYIITGLIIGPQFLNVFKSTETLLIFSEMGIAILLFIVGLHLKPTELKDYGKSTLIVGLGQILITTGLGFLLSTLLGFSLVTSLYIGMSLTFSSTIIVLKLLADKKDLEKLYSKISIGVLLLQDIVAALCLIALSTFANGNSQGISSILQMLIKATFLTLVLSLVSVYVLPKLSDFFAKSQEYLFLFSLGWGFGLATLFTYLGFSVEIGALVAGIALSVTPYSQEISSRLKPLRDFFVVMFFIVLGSQINLGDIQNLLMPLFVFLIFVVVVKPFIIMFLVWVTGYTKRIGFFSGTSLAQISEFSMILCLLGLKLGHLEQSVVSLVTFVGILSILFSAYIINYAEKLYPHLSTFIPFVDKKSFKREVDLINNYEVILFGCNRVGFDFINEFKELGTGFLAVDFDPEIIKELHEKNINCTYGDAEDAEFLEDISVDQAKIVISTIPDAESNLFLLSKIRDTNTDSTVILISYNVDEAIKLYENEASYVILPHFIGGEFAANLAKESGFDVKKLHGERNQHIAYLHARKSEGHAHPKWEHH